jgi:hypothetical protein
MSIVGHHPDHGVRVVLERPRGVEPPWRYEGEAIVHTASFGVSVTLQAGGDVTVETHGEAPPGLIDRVRLIVRAAWKHAHEEGAAPPRRIARWRADR